MCLPFNCGGGGGERGDHGHGSPPHPVFHHPHPRPAPPPPLSPPPYVPPPLSPPPPPPRYDDQAYKTFPVTPPFEEAYGQHAPGTMAAGSGGKGMKGGVEAAAPRHHHGAGRTKNNGGHMMAFEDNPYASMPAQAPHQRKDVYTASSPLHGRPVSAAPHQKEHTEKMRAPAVAQMARRGGEEEYYPAVAAATTTTMTPAANNLYGDRGHAYGDEGNRKPQGNTWW